MQHSTANVPEVNTEDTGKMKQTGLREIVGVFFPPREQKYQCFHGLPWKFPLVLLKPGINDAVHETTARWHEPATVITQ